MDIQLKRVAEINNEIAPVIIAIAKFLPIPLILIAAIRFLTGDPVRAYIPFGAVLPTFLTLFILRKGHLKYAIIYLAVLITVLDTLVCITGMGIHDIAIITFPVVILFSSLTLEFKHLIAIFILVFTALFLITMGEYWNWYTPTSQNPGTLADSIIVSTVCIVTVSITYRLSRNTLLATNRQKIEFEKTNDIKLKLNRMADKKSELLREVHHRVKNNLAFVNSLIDIEMMENREEIEYLKTFQSKIISLARANNPLFQGDNYELVDLKTYLKDLSENSYHHKNVAFTANSIPIQIRQAVPIGVIVHEIILIIQKHRERAVEVYVIKNQQNYSLEIKSDNVSMKQSFENMPLEKSLVEIMIADLGGKFSIEKGVFLLTF
ncbi:MAG: sensor histidine kinase [Cytophagales bacterium]|nr:sensor histidine kinase [Cytophagales bacterium]